MPHSTWTTTRPSTWKSSTGRSKPARWDIESGINGPYIAVGNLYFESMEAMQAGMGSAGEALADVPNFTNAESAVQVSEIVDS